MPSRLVAVVATLALCTSARAELIHRYSFNDTDKTVKDSVGDANGTLKGDAKIQDGKVVVDNNSKPSSDAGVSYVEFNKSVLPKGDSVSLVVWVQAKPSDVFTRVLDIGDSDSGEGKAFIYLMTRHDDDKSRAAISAEGPGEKTYLGGAVLDDNKPHVAALVIDGKEKKLRYYVDGKEAAPAEDLGSNTLDKVRATHSWLIRSGFDSDPTMSGSIDEFRVYDHALTEAEAKSISDAGPDTLPDSKATTKP